MRPTMPVFLAAILSFVSLFSFAEEPNEDSAIAVEFKIEKDEHAGTHSIHLDVTDLHGTVILTSESGQVLAYKTFMSSTSQVSFDGLASGTYMLCVKHDRRTMVETITIP